MTLGHYFVPYFLPRRAAKVLDDGTSDVEHYVDPERNVAGPPEGVVDSKGNKETCPFEENAGFEQHDDDAVQDVIVVHVLRRISPWGSIVAM